ncbi:MAG: type IV pilus assembly protein PilM [Kiritimatiellia bacterium]|jgi:type IV pilus assembly protein PilM|nr:type IV pilus assembly protein PilM [Kiritimatiellia bacterium]MDP6810681.1 type IV pilus assembly protein PilM [Kiritimatiellia bacterium]MDP7023332.1 type IV pilus assembly protein PilM [Kiritimatiellia bacterium]
MFKSDRLLALDVGASKLVLSEFRATKSGVPQLVDYAVGKLDIGSDWEADTSAYIVSTIREMMRERRMKPAPLVMSVSGQAVFPRYVKLPPVGRDKVMQMVHYEAEQNVPFPIEEVVWDYQLVSGVGSEELNVMLVAAKIESIKRLTDCVQAAGLEPEIVDVAPMALYNVVRYNYPGLEGCTMVLDIGARSSNLIFVEENRIFSRSIPVAGNAATQELMKEFDVGYDEAEELKHQHGFVALGGVYAGPEDKVADRVSRIVRGVVTRLHAEVSRSINFYRSQQGGSPPARAFLTGGTSVLPHMDTFFREKLKVPVEALNPFANIPVSPTIDQDRITGDIQLLGEVAGLALRRTLTCPVEISLLPPDIVARKTMRRRQPFFAMAALGVVLIMLCWWVYFLRMREMLGERVTKVEARVGGLSAQAGKLQKVRKESAAVQAEADQLTSVIRLRTAWLDILESVRGVMLDGMWLTGWAPVIEDGRVTAVGISARGFMDQLKDLPDATATEQFAARLRALECFTEATKITRERGGGSDDFAREFTVEAPLAEPIVLDPVKGSL